jgi:hypothetical protein
MRVGVFCDGKRSCGSGRENGNGFGTHGRGRNLVILRAGDASLHGIQVTGQALRFSLQFCIELREAL